MPSISSASKKMIILMCILFIIECIGGLIFFGTIGNSIGFFAGAFIGTFLSAIRLILLERALNKSVNMEKKVASSYMNRQYFFRYMIAAVSLVLIAISHPRINLIGAGIGLINMQISAYLYGLFLNPQDES